MTAQTGKQMITMHIFPNISRMKLTMKFGQLKYNMKNILFFEK